MWGNNEIKQQLAELKKYTLLAAKDMLTMEDAVLYTGFSKSYLYVLTCKHKIPFYKPNGKTLMFKKSELNDWLSRNRVGPIDEVEPIIIDEAVRTATRLHLFAIRKIKEIAEKAQKDLVNSFIRKKGVEAMMSDIIHECDKCINWNE